MHEFLRNSVTYGDLHIVGKVETSVTCSDLHIVGTVETWVTCSELRVRRFFFFLILFQ